MGLTITNKLLIEEGNKCNIKHFIISEKHNLVLLEHKGVKKLVRRAVTERTNAIVRYIADHKDATYKLLDYYGFTVPQTLDINSLDELNKIEKEVNYPLVVKPEDGACGEGVTVGIKNYKELKEAFQFAKEFNYKDILIQEFIEGDDYRILIVGYKVIAIAKRLPCRIFGDGVLKIKELIEKENKNPLRGEEHDKALTLINIDKTVLDYLKEQNLSLDKVLDKNQEIFLRKNANLSTGGEAIDVTDKVPDENKKIFEEIAKSMDGNIVGIDIRTKDISKIFKDKKDYAVIELNASPGIRMHHFPSEGNKINVALEILKNLFPNLE